MAIYNKQIKITREQLIDHYLKRDTFPDYIYGLVRFFGIIVQNIYCVSSYLVLSWIILFPISWIRSDLYSKLENYLYNSLLFIVSSWSMAAGATVVETGDEYKHLIEEPEKYQTECKLPKADKMNGLRGSHHNFESNNQVNNLNLKHKLTSGDMIQSTTNYTSDKNSDSISNTNQSGDQVTTTLVEPESDLSQANDNLASSCCPKVVSIDNNNDNSFARKSNICTINNSSAQTIINQAKNNMNGGPFMNYESPRKPRILLLCNHISTADVPLIMQSFSSLTNQSILWVLDAQFKPTNFGLVCSSHGDFFIAKDSFVDGSLRDQVLKHPDRNLLVLFPEGGFLRKRLEGSNRYALRNNLPMTKYVTHPRFGAFKDLIDPSVGVTHIVDATLLYDDLRNPLSILDIALGSRKEPVIMTYKIYNRSEINPTEEWLRNIWLEKDKLVQQYYEDRSSLYKRFEGTLRSAKLDWFKVLSVHLFYLLVCYLTIYRLFSATSVTMLKARDLYYSNI